MGNPVLEINVSLIRKSAAAVRAVCAAAGINPTAVVKGYNALDEVTEALADAGYQSFASSRLPHLKRVKDRLSAETMALRIPMQSEVVDVVELADISLNSELATVRLLDLEAARQKKRHKVILMRDLGDLREGFIDEERFVETACAVERGCGNIILHGVGTNLSCYGSVIPTPENLSILLRGAWEIERRIGRRLDVISGGASTSLYLVVNGEMPNGVNHLRIGAANLLLSEASNVPEGAIPELTDETFILKAEIIEIGEKPTHPIGKLGTDAFGNVRTYEDKGVRRRALLAVGAFDAGDHKKLVPLDKGVVLLGCSSDHMIADIEDSEQNYRLGDTVAMTTRYQAMLFATENDLVEKRFVE
ncbi:MAG: alanine racemase [Synergistaceae bacterium]|jgi:predicted amino acid racemase|nr:alanine racemase [Synergistaceae bacterium]